MRGWPVGYSLSRCDTGQGPERKPRERSGSCHTGGWMMIDDVNP
nr:MAG TPA: UBX domain-containing protein [Caudoviricetes sp.]